MITSKIKYITIPLIAAAALWGCGGDGAECPAGSVPTDGGDPAAISFRGGWEGTAGVTRAVGDFPNSTIGVTATYTTTTDDWTQFEDINNDMAEVTGESSGIFTFSWRPRPDTVRYWPFNGDALYFAAYSPHTSESDAITLYNDLTHLGIQIGEDTPDVMYATDNGRTAWSKSSTQSPVDLGTFNHALSELTVIVTADSNSFKSGIRIGSLRVTTERPYGVLDLLGDVDDNLALVVEPDYTYNLVTASTPFSLADPYTSTVYLFPGTEQQTYITVTLIDSTFSYTVTYLLSDIEYDNSPGDYLTLVRAKNTTVRFVVKSTTVQNPQEGLVLKGALTDWIDKGDLEVTIN